MKTILVVDDEIRLVNLVKAYLEQEGFRVVTAGDGQKALFVARHEKPDLIILDIMMPEMDGYEFMRQYRKESEAPVILLTAKVDETDKVLGLELGADDYVTKPFGSRELVARVRAVLRRLGRDLPEPEVLRAADITLDRASHAVLRGGEPIDLTPTEFDLLGVLMASPGRVYSRVDLLERIQGVAFESYDRTIDVHIKNLRKKIESDPAAPQYIETVYGIGYRFTVH